MSPIGCLQEPDALFLKIPLRMPLASDVPWSMLGQITKKHYTKKAIRRNTDRFFYVFFYAYLT